MNKINKSKVLKSLQTQRTEMKTELEIENNKLDRTKKGIYRLNQRISKIDNDIEKLTDKEIIISEHAILRYIERVLKIDMDDLRERILTDNTRDLIEKLGENGSYPVSDSHRVIVKNNLIVTVEV